MCSVIIITCFPFRFLQVFVIVVINNSVLQSMKTISDKRFFLFHSNVKDKLIKINKQTFKRCRHKKLKIMFSFERYPRNVK